MRSGTPVAEFMGVIKKANERNKGFLGDQSSGNEKTPHCGTGKINISGILKGILSSQLSTALNAKIIQAENPGVKGQRMGREYLAEFIINSAGNNVVHRRAVSDNKKVLKEVTKLRAPSVERIGNNVINLSIQQNIKKFCYGPIQKRQEGEKAEIKKAWEFNLKKVETSEPEQKRLGKESDPFLANIKLQESLCQDREKLISFNKLCSILLVT